MNEREGIGADRDPREGSKRVMGSGPTNRDIADRLDEVGELLSAQHANPFRVRAYQRAASQLRQLDREVVDLYAEGGLAALQALPGVGESLARAIRDLIQQGRLAMLDRLRGDVDPVRLLRTVPGIGPVLAETFHHRLGIDSLEDLEVAAQDGALALAGLGPRRIAAITATLKDRLATARRTDASPAPDLPSVEEILDVDREYRERAAAGTLRTIAPRRMNPRHEAWLPILHTMRGSRHYTVLFSNTPRAHQAGTTHDWVVLYFDHDGSGGERQCTVITSRFGPLAGRRIVRGREHECLALLRHHELAAAIEAAAHEHAPDRQTARPDPWQRA